MRGKAFANYVTLGRERITPAYAGKSFFRRCGRYSGQDHPRLCGEKRRCIPRCSGAIGSPPPMRGKVVKLRHSQWEQRITPAYAGKRFRFERSQCRFWDHPRLCGEKQSDKMLRRCLEGSPPPMRGKANGTASFSDGYRITPAYAGKSLDSYTIGVPVIRITPAYAGKSDDAERR